ncbi:hypothetical protein QF035_002395 [Streptomyces umbrinus]|uniref:AAA+ ATPase domain-containing protein n=1 Tax=Streptomyces umbrinus TaxID=67370 RepID=A0ABU0SMM7_9ACTN|nr:AAA domain-containing protein [Streptomyces umbrinus]MDQ1024813.1 hypothetical protein [Streptomyces umbrinus]
MTEWTLGTPDSWIAELSDILTAETRPVSDRPVIPLTFRLGLPRKLAELGTDCHTVETDLAAGLTSKRYEGRDEEYYRLSGARFDVYVSTQFAEGSSLPLAVVTSVKARRGLPYRGPVLQAHVDFHPAYDEQVCDIAVVHRDIKERLRHQRAVADARDRSARLLQGRSTTVGAHSGLHAQVRRHFSALIDMIELLQQRGETENTRTAQGVVAAADDPAASAHPNTVCVRTHRRQGEFEYGFILHTSPIRSPGEADDTRASEGGPWKLEVVAAEDDFVYLEPPTKGHLAPGTLVDLRYKPKFALDRHNYALQHFLREEVEGDWSALARLLSDPGSLSGPAEGFSEPPAFFDDGLNQEQRAAVAGALGTPHAFFIQGPPGTGKTTVISEIVRQLTARGERVLLLAPMHVAVDEVLRRVGQADGVLALRVSYDDSRVKPELRSFTRDNLARQFVRQARRPAASRAEIWRAEREQLSAEAELIESCTGARGTLKEAEAARDQVAAARATWWAGNQDAVARATAQLAKARAEADQAAARLALADREQARVAEALAAVEGRIILRIKALFGKGELAVARAAHREARRALRDARAERKTADQRLTERERTADDLAREEATQERAHHEAWARAGASVDAARRRVDETTARLATADAALTHLDAEQLARRARSDHDRADRLQRFTHLEQRWFRLAGLTDASSRDAQDLLGALGRQLPSTANLVCCTTVGFAGEPGVRDADFDTLIIDEASRVIDSEFLIGARQARRWVLVGDERQLPPYVDPADEYHLHALAALHMTERRAAPDLHTAVEQLAQLWEEDEELHRFRVEPVQRTAGRIRDSGVWSSTYRRPYQAAYERLRNQNEDAERELLGRMRRHLVQSLFERCVAEDRQLSQALVEQRRMIEPIAQLVKGPVYGGRYVTPSPERLGLTPLVTANTFPRPMVFLDTSDNPRAGEEQVGTGCVNALEAEWVAAACRMWERELSARGERQVTVSVLTFYKAQAREIRRLLGGPGFPGFRVLDFQVVDAIDRIQGQESDLVFLSFCRTRRGRQRERHRFALWLQDVRRLNVACSRARRAIVLVGHRNTLAGLRGIPAAEQFYANMFDLFAHGHPDTVLLKQLEQVDR